VREFIFSKDQFADSLASPVFQRLQRLPRQTQYLVFRIMSMAISIFFQIIFVGQ
jgi:hypothetical protein